MAALRIRAAPCFGRDHYCCYTSYSPQITFRRNRRSKQPSPDVGVAPLRYGLQLPFASDGKLEAVLSLTLSPEMEEVVFRVEMLDVVLEIWRRSVGDGGTRFRRWLCTGWGGRR